MKAPTDVDKIKQQLVQQQKELLELQQRKLMLELEQTKQQLEAKQKELHSNKTRKLVCDIEQLHFENLNHIYIQSSSNNSINAL